jgi:FtsP/CotA-like multicopper oxidase with cupredoxin domain
MRCPRDDGRGKEHTLVVDYNSARRAIFRIQRENGEKSISSPYPDGEDTPWKVNSPPWQQDLMNEVVDPANIHNVTLSPTNVNFDGTIYQYDPTVNCSVLQYDTVYEFNVFRTSVHPYHLHAYPMQVQSGCEPHLIGEFYDTMSSMETDCTVRFRTLGESGKTPMHCHLLRHEDAGAMTWMWVEGGPSLNPNPEPPIDSCYA